MNQPEFGRHLSNLANILTEVVEEGVGWIASLIFVISIECVKWCSQFVFQPSISVLTMFSTLLRNFHCRLSSEMKHRSRMVLLLSKSTSSTTHPLCVVCPLLKARTYSWRLCDLRRCFAWCLPSSSGHPVSPCNSSGTKSSGVLRFCVQFHLLAKCFAYLH